MEEEVNWLKYAIGIKFDRMDKGWYLGFACYWFCVMFHRNLGPDTFYFENAPRWTGLMFFYGLNRDLKPGDPIWAKCKKWGSYAT